MPAGQGGHPVGSAAHIHQGDVKPGLLQHQALDVNHRPGVHADFQLAGVFLAVVEHILQGLEA